MSDRPIDFDSFVLEHRVGAGGMGEVWKGRHEEDDVDVAIKLLIGARAQVPLYREDFRREVQAVARLNHPHIVMVFDYGTVSPTAAGRSRGALVAGSPFLVMEYACEGALDGLQEPMSWARIRESLLAVLDGLGHSHSRGVIHRDIKPANILLGSDRDLRPTLKLTDFGLAHASEKQTSTRRQEPTAENVEDASGTPAYMAPEQFRGRWRDYGPWTDLYALGIVAYELVCGRLPYRSEKFHGYADFHLYQPLPPLEPQVAVPEEFELWLHRMTAKGIRHRFRRAADAAWALRQLGGPKPSRVETIGVPMDVLGAGAEKRADVDESDDDSLGTMKTLVKQPPEPDQEQRGADSVEIFEQMETLAQSSSHETNGDLQVGPIESAETIPALDSVGDADSATIASKEDRLMYGRDMELVTPPSPADWREAVEVPEPVPLLGVGLGLYGLREIPVVDRQRVRDGMWSKLRQCRAQQQPGCVVLEGGSGTGKSQLAQWLCQVADEIGTATVLRATHEPNPGTVQGLPRMLADFFRVVGMSFDEAQRRLKSIVRREGVDNDYEWRALAEFVRPLTQASGNLGSRSFDFASPRQRFVLLHRFLTRLGRSRPVVVWLDDVQWGAEALMLVEHVLEESEDDDTPVLFVLTVRSDALAVRPTEAGGLESLQARTDVHHHPIGPLEDEDAAQLVERLLGLSGELAERVTDRTGGNPLFAVELVGDWVDRGVLVPGPSGFILRPGEEALLPDDLHAMWRDRIENLLRDHGQEARRALEIAAVLGQEVNRREWQAACEQVEVSVADELIEHLVNARLIVPGDNGWSFAHGMLRECLERMCTEADRSSQFHRACETVLRELYPDQHRRMSERRAHHVLEAGELDRGAELLMSAAEYRFGISEYNHVHEVLGRRDKVLDRLQTGDGDRRRAWGMMLRAEAYRLSWDFDRSAELASEIKATAIKCEWELLQAEAMAVLAHVARQRGDVEGALELNGQARDLFVANRHQEGVAKTTLLQAICNRLRGDLEDSRAHYHQALKIFDELDMQKKVGQVYYGLGCVERQGQNLELARRHYNRARKICDRIGAQQTQANALNGLAEVARYQGDLEAAEAGYRQALELFESIGVGDQVLPRLNLGLVYQERRDFGVARRCFEEGLERLSETGQRAFVGWTHANLLPALADAGEWTKWDEHFEFAVKLLEETGLVDADIARAATLAGQIARDAGRGSRARRAFEFARQQWQAAGDDERVQSIDLALRELIEH